MLKFKLLVLFLLFPILCRAETLQLKWNNPRQEDCRIVYGDVNVSVSFSKPIGKVSKFTLDLKDNSEYYIYVSMKSGQSNVIYYKTKENKVKNRKPPEIKLEVEK